MPGEYGEGQRIRYAVLNGEITGINKHLVHPPDSAKQKQLVYSFLYHDPSVITTNRQDIYITDREQARFTEAVRNGLVLPTSQHRSWNSWTILDYAPSPVDLITTIEQAVDEALEDKRMRMLLEDLTQQWGRATRAGTISLLKDYPGPEMLNDELVSMASRFSRAGITNNGETIKVADAMMHILYGEKQAYYEQLRRVFEHAFGVQRAATEPIISFRRTAPEVTFTRTSPPETDPIAALEARIQKLTEERDQANTRAANAEKALKERDQADPQGYYKALGLDPEVARDLSDEALQILIKGAKRGLGMDLHPDNRDKGDLERAKKVMAAADFLSDPLKRKSYRR